MSGSDWFVMILVVILAFVAGSGAARGCRANWERQARQNSLQAELVMCQDRLKEQSILINKIAYPPKATD